MSIRTKTRSGAIHLAVTASIAVSASIGSMARGQGVADTSVRAAYAYAIQERLIDRHRIDAALLIETAGSLVRSGRLTPTQASTWLETADRLGVEYRSKERFDSYGLEGRDSLAWYVATITRDARLAGGDELKKVAETWGIGAEQRVLSDYCRIAACPNISGPQIVDLGPQVNRIVEQLNSDPRIRSIAEEYLQARHGVEVTLESPLDSIIDSSSSMRGNEFVESLDNLLNGRPGANPPWKEFDSLVSQFKKNVEGLDRYDFADQFPKNISDVQAGLGLLTQVAGFADPALGRDMDRAMNAWSQLQKTKAAFESVNSLSNAFAMANSYVFAAQIGMNLLSGGNPLQPGGADDNARYFEQLFQALKSMSEYMEKRFDAVDKRLDVISAQLKNIQTTLDSLDRRIANVEDATTTLRKMLNQVQNDLDTLKILVVRGASVPVENSYSIEGGSCFRKLLTGEAPDITYCTTVYKSYAMEHAEQVFGLDAAAGQSSASLGKVIDALVVRDDPNRPQIEASLAERGFDLNVKIRGSSDYANYVELLIRNKTKISKNQRKIIEKDLEELERSFLRRSRAYRQLLWSKVDEAVPSLFGAKFTRSAYVRIRHDSLLEQLLENLNLTPLRSMYVGLAEQVRGANENYNYGEVNLSPPVVSQRNTRVGLIFCADLDVMIGGQTIVVRVDPEVSKKFESERKSRALSFRKEVKTLMLNRHAAELSNWATQVKLLRDLLADGLPTFSLELDPSERQALKRIVGAVDAEAVVDAIEVSLYDYVCRKRQHPSDQYSTSARYPEANELPLTHDGALQSLEGALARFSFNQERAEDDLEFRSWIIPPLQARLRSLRAEIR